VTIADRADEVRARLERAAARAGRRPDEVTLVAVSKAQPVAAVRGAHAAGLRAFGENYVQEWAEKAAMLADLELAWHFIGHLQRNKAKEVAGRVALIHGVDSPALAEALARRAPATQDVLVEVNVAGETTKSGIAPAELAPLLEAMARLPQIRCRGLMAIPPPDQDNRLHFRALAALARAHGLPELSMGMSDDFEVAVEEGATIVRVGTAIFGPRPIAP